MLLYILVVSNTTRLKRSCGCPLCGCMCYPRSPFVDPSMVVPYEATLSIYGSLSNCSVALLSLSLSLSLLHPSALATTTTASPHTHEYARGLSKRHTDHISTTPRSHRIEVSTLRTDIDVSKPIAHQGDCKTSMLLVSRERYVDLGSMLHGSAMRDRGVGRKPLEG